MYDMCYIYSIRIINSFYEMGFIVFSVLFLQTFVFTQTPEAKSDGLSLYYYKNFYIKFNIILQPI